MWVNLENFASSQNECFHFTDIAIKVLLPSPLTHHCESYFFLILEITWYRYIVYCATYFFHISQALSCQEIGLPAVYHLLTYWHIPCTAPSNYNLPFTLAVHNYQSLLECLNGLLNVSIALEVSMSTTVTKNDLYSWMMLRQWGVNPEFSRFDWCLCII